MVIVPAARAAAVTCTTQNAPKFPRSSARRTHGIFEGPASEANRNRLNSGNKFSADRMPYHDDLIQHGIFLSELNLPDEPKQVDLRRAVSAAYYSLFHLLTLEAAENWKHPTQRNRFARLFDHGRMKACSSKLVSRPLPADAIEATVAADLRLVADSFIKLQQARHTADYDNAKTWSHTDVWKILALTEDARVA